MATMIETRIELTAAKNCIRELPEDASRIAQAFGEKLQNVGVVEPITSFLRSASDIQGLGAVTLALIHPENFAPTLMIVATLDATRRRDVIGPFKTSFGKLFDELETPQSDIAVRYAYCPLGGRELSTVLEESRAGWQTEDGLAKLAIAKIV